MLLCEMTQYDTLRYQSDVTQCVTLQAACQTLDAERSFSIFFCKACCKAISKSWQGYVRKDLIDATRCLVRVYIKS